MCILAVPHLFRGRLIVMHDFAHRDNVRPSVLLVSDQTACWLWHTVGVIKRYTFPFRLQNSPSRTVLVSLPFTLWSVPCLFFSSRRFQWFFACAPSGLVIYSGAAWRIFNKCRFRLVFWRWKRHGYQAVLRNGNTYFFFNDAYCNFSVCKNVKFYGKTTISYLGQL